MPESTGSVFRYKNLPEWVTRIKELAHQIAPPGFCGKVEINFLNGGVTSVNKTESYR
jgi:hypothetical protein